MHLNQVSRETKYCAEKSIITYTEGWNNIGLRYILDVAPSEFKKPIKMSSVDLISP